MTRIGSCETGKNFVKIQQVKILRVKKVGKRHFKFKMSYSHNSIDELDNLKSLITSWVSFYLNLLRHRGDPEIGQEIKQVESNLAQEALRLLHSRDIDTTDVENICRDAQALSRNPDATASETDQVVRRLRTELNNIFEDPRIQGFIQSIRIYYRRILAYPALLTLNQQIYNKLLEYLLNPLQSDPSQDTELNLMLQRFLQTFLNREQDLKEQD